VFHLQTDGILEGKNQWIEQYLRLVTSMSPEDWTYWLAIATAIHNNRQNKTIRLLPNQILLGYEVTLHPEEETPSNSEAIEMRIKDMVEKRAQAVNAINQTTQKGQVILVQYKLGEQVWLEVTHLKVHH
jgi:hypothetical protein